MNKRTETESVASATYGAIKAMIVNHDITPGAVIEERKLADELGVSRTPLRAAISRLLGENLLKRISDRTTVVQSMSFKDMFELIEVRKCLESQAAALATPLVPLEQVSLVRSRIENFLEKLCDGERDYWDIDQNFHDLIAINTPNQNLVRIITDVRTQARLFNPSRVSFRVSRAARCQLAVLDAIEARDAKTVKKLMIVHLEEVKDGLKELLDSEYLASRP